MKTRKKIAIGCGGIVAISIISIVGLFLFIGAKKDKYDKIAIPFFEEIMPILSTWNSSSLESYWAPEVLEVVNPDQMKRLFGTYKRLGHLEQYDSPQFQKIFASTSNPYGSLVTYVFSAQYENGNATLSYSLVPTDSDGLKIWSLYINSDVFLDPIEDDQDN